LSVTVLSAIITDAWHASRDSLPLGKKKKSKFCNTKEGRKEGRKEEGKIGRESLSLSEILKLIKLIKYLSLFLKVF